MGFTLISSVGTGMYDKNQNGETGYRQTEYLFPNGVRIKSRLFLDAVLESSSWRVEKVILVGTRTSSWDALIAKYCDLDEATGDLWLKLVSECESDANADIIGVSDDTLYNLELLLSKRLHIPCSILVHTSTVDADTLTDVFSTYRRLPELIPTNTDILFDITHGFRSMPLFIYQSLRFAAHMIQNRDVKILYGEYVKENKVSHVRDLSSFWGFSEVVEAMEVFRKTLSGEALVSKIQPWWPRGAKWMQGFSNLVKANYVLQIKESMNQLRNALSESLSDKSPMWATEILMECRSILERFDGLDSISDHVFAFALILEEKDLMTQAVIAMQVAVESRIVEYRYDDRHLGDYSYWIEPGGPRDFKRDLEREHGLLQLRELEAQRNRIAHGGGSQSHKRPPSLVRLPSRDDVVKYKTDVLRLFSICR
jgi:CRISPR-associated Csx2 family protein